MNKTSSLNRPSASTERTKHSAIQFTIAIVSIMALASPNTASAGGVVGNGASASCNQAALIDALSGGGTVSFNCGSQPKTIPVTAELTISQDTVIDGGNLITLDGGNSTRLFIIKPEIRFTVNNLTLANGYTTAQGGAIHSGMFQNTVLTINHCTFNHNVSSQPNEAGGGAIYSGAGYLTITNSVFSNNEASMGGAIRILHSNLTVTNTMFSHNKAVDPDRGNGGAIVIDGAKYDDGKIIIRKSKFLANSATAFGGALFNNIYNNNSTTITDSVFTGNAVGGVTKGQGGAIWSNGDPTSGDQWTIYANNTTLTIVNTTVSDNISGQQGGGIWIARHPKGSVISRSTFSGNTALNSMGGGLVQGGTGKLTIINSTFSNNQGKGTYSMGAGIYIADTAKAAITNTTITGNTAQWQAGGIFGGTNVTLKNTILAGNIALNGGHAWDIKHNCFESMRNGGNNLQFPNPKDPPCATGMLLADPKLGPLANNGGLTQTHAILPGSAASQNGSGCPATDQRGAKRPNPAGTSCDTGAFEAVFY